MMQNPCKFYIGMLPMYACIWYKLSVTSGLYSFKLCGIFYKEELKSLGDACVARYSRPGICKTINRCTSVRADLMNGNQNYVECSHRGMTLIVCCPMTERNSTNKTRITATPPPSSLRISAQSNYSKFEKA